MSVGFLLVSVGFGVVVVLGGGVCVCVLGGRRAFASWTAGRMACSRDRITKRPLSEKNTTN